MTDRLCGSLVPLQDHVQKYEARRCSKLKRMVNNLWEQNGGCSVSKREAQQQLTAKARVEQNKDIPIMGTGRVFARGAQPAASFVTMRGKKTVNPSLSDFGWRASGEEPRELP